MNGEIKMKFILASASPRRKELMEMLGVDELTVLPAKGEEKADKELAPEELVKALARAKAEEIAPCAGLDDVVIAADTVVWVDGRLFGKPHTKKEAYEMLRTLSGRAHEVFTGLTVIRNGIELTESERSLVYFRDLSDEEINAYIETGEPMDKAGAYGAQGKAALFVKKIDGDFFNVMGLPLCRLGEMLKKQGVVIL